MRGVSAVADSIRFARSESTPGLRTGMTPLSHRSRRTLFFRLACSVLLLWAARWLAAQQVPEPVEIAALPDAPQSQVVSSPKDARQVAPRKNCPPTSALTGEPENASAGCTHRFDFSHPLGKPPGRGTLASRDKLSLAASDVADPFNLITIGATAAISIGSNPNTEYGPGMKGWAKNSGTLLTEDLTGAFFVTFLVPSLTGQDPRYHRMLNASIPRRITNAIVQPVWTESDQGNHMLNCGDLIGVPATIALANVYVPGRKRGVGPTAGSSAIAIALAPIDNFVSEFLPDVANHVSIRIVFIQRIVNHIALTGGPN